MTLSTCAPARSRCWSLIFNFFELRSNLNFSSKAASCSFFASASCSSWAFNLATVASCSLNLTSRAEACSWAVVADEAAIEHQSKSLMDATQPDVS